MGSKKVYLDVVCGPEGNSLNIGNDDHGHRLAGPKPWGGGQTIHRFEVDPDELIREAQAYKEFANEDDEDE